MLHIVIVVSLYVDEWNRLRDLRHVTTSAEMARVLIQGLTEAFNSGNIQPTGNDFLSY